MIKKIFQYIIVFAFILIPSVSSAEITLHVYTTNIKPTSTNVTLTGTVEQNESTEKVYAGFRYSSNPLNCPEMPGSGLANVNMVNDDPKHPDAEKIGSISTQLTGLQPGQIYYYCLVGLEGKDDIDNTTSGSKKYSNRYYFVTPPILDFKINGLTDKAEVNYGGNVKITWETKGAGLCIAKNDLTFINTPNNNGTQSIPTSGNKTLEKIYDKKIYTIECLAKNGSNSTTKNIEVTIKGRDEDKIGKVVTLPTDKNIEPEITVDVTDKSAKLKGKLDNLLTSSTNNPSPEHCKNGIKDGNETGVDIGGSCTGAYAYFRISKISIPPIFCNDIFGSNMIAVTATSQNNNKISGGKLKGPGEFLGTIDTLEPDTEYAYCAIVSNHPTTPTEIEYGQVVRFRTNPCFNCPHTSIRTLKPTRITNNSAILQGSYNSTRNIKVWFEYRPKWGGQYVPTPTDGGQFEIDSSTFLDDSNNILKNKLFGLVTLNSSQLSLSILKNLISKKTANADLDLPSDNNEWHKITDSEITYNKKRNYGRKQFTLIGLSRDTIYQYKIVAETIQDPKLYPNPNPTQKFEGAIVEFRTKSVSDGVNPLAHCFNGIQDFGETGVDTGGGCPGKAASCSDGIKNQNETGIDTGGICGDKPINNCLNGIQDFGETGVDTGGPCDPNAPDCFDDPTTPEEETCENEDCPTGYNGNYGNCIPNQCPTGYQGTPTDNLNPPTGCFFIPPLPTCTDGIQNGSETGIDIGGGCGDLPPTCTDGIQNGDETGIDTGGKCGEGPKEKVTVDIKAKPVSIEEGSATTISWTSKNATSCIVSGYRNGQPAGTNESFGVKLEKTTSYTATCTGPNGSGSDSVTVFVYPKNEFVFADITVKPSYINKTGPVTVNWTSKNATSCIVHGKAIEGKTGLNGGFGLGIPNIDKSQSWSIECTGKNGTRASDTAYVIVGNINIPPTCYDDILNGTETEIDVGPDCPKVDNEKDKVKVNIKADENAVVIGGRTTISWTSTNAESCIITNYRNGKTNGPSGQFSAININTTTSWTATCTGPKGSGSDTVTVYTYKPSEVLTVVVKAKKGNIKKGEGTTISWTSTNAESCISSGGGGTGTTGSFETGPLDQSKTYSVECKNTTKNLRGSGSAYVYVNTYTGIPLHCYNGIQDTDKGETGIDIGGPCGTGNGGGGNNDYCPEGWLQEDGSCKPTYECPTASNGIWPNCKWTVNTDPTPCPTTKGWTGTNWPGCKYVPECPSGMTGTYPNCKTEINIGSGNIPCPTTKGWTGTNWPGCKYVPECPSGMTGTYPNCKTERECLTGWTGTYPNCKFTKECPDGTTGEYPNCKITNPTGECPSGTTGIYPNCKITTGEFCPNGYSGTPPNCTLNPTCPVGYTGNPPTCVASTTCPTNWEGTWPNCKFIGDNNDDDDNNDNTCPNGTTGTYPNCSFTQTCPEGFTGTWPICTSGPTTNIAHCSNGVQDFGETAIDIGGGCGGVYNSGATCFDNIKNGDETGTDEGGHCGDGPNNNGEYPSCFDNIKNGDETGIDIGGHCGDINTDTDWVDVVFPDHNGTGTTSGNCINGICTGTWDGNFPGIDGPINGSCRAGQYTDCTFTGNCINGVCTGTWDGNFPGQNGPFVGTINGGIGDGKGLGNNDWLDSVFLNLAGEGTIKGSCVNGICSGEWKGVCLGVNGPLVGVWNGETATGPYTGTRENNKCSGKWNGVIAGNNGELIGKWKGDGIGLNDGKELYIGYEGIPDVDDIVRYHEGIEHVFIRRIMINTELARHYGYQKGQNLLNFAWDLAHRLAKEFGYVDSEGKEIRVSQPDVSAYQLRLVGDKITVYEYYKNKIIDLRDRTTIFKNKNNYEYYFVK